MAHITQSKSSRNLLFAFWRLDVCSRGSGGASFYWRVWGTHLVVPINPRHCSAWQMHCSSPCVHLCSMLTCVSQHSLLLHKSTRQLIKMISSWEPCFLAIGYTDEMPEKQKEARFLWAHSFGGFILRLLAQSSISRQRCSLFHGKQEAESEG